MKGLAASLVLSTFVFTSTAYSQTDPNAKINLELVAQNDAPVSVGETFEVALMMSAATTPQRYLVADIIFGWDETKLKFIDVNHTGSHPMIWVPPSGMPCPTPYTTCAGIGGDYTGINESIPPADGDGLYYGYGALGQVFIVTAPVQIVRFEFEVIAPFTTTEVQILPQVVTSFVNKTVIYGSYVAGLPVTGTLTNAVIEGVSLTGDINGDGAVGPADLSQLIANWGAVGAAKNPCDINGDGVVNGGDLAILFGNWTR